MVVPKHALSVESELLLYNNKLRLLSLDFIHTQEAQFDKYLHQNRFTYVVPS